MHSKEPEPALLGILVADRGRLCQSGKQKPAPEQGAQHHCLKEGRTCFALLPKARGETECRRAGLCPSLLLSALILLNIFKVCFFFL